MQQYRHLTKVRADSLCAIPQHVTIHAHRHRFIYMCTDLCYIKQCRHALIKPLGHHSTDVSLRGLLLQAVSGSRPSPSSRVRLDQSIRDCLPASPCVAACPYACLLLSNTPGLILGMEHTGLRRDAVCSLHMPLSRALTTPVLLDLPWPMRNSALPACFCCACAASTQTKELILATCESQRCVLQQITYSSVISALAKGKQWAMAIDIFSHMQEAGVEPDVVTCCRWLPCLAS